MQKQLLSFFLPPSTFSSHSLSLSFPQELNEKIAHLKDQLQELKAKTGLEAKYTSKATQVRGRGRLHGSMAAGHTPGYCQLIMWHYIIITSL